MWPSSTLQPGGRPQERPPSVGSTPSLPCGSETWALRRGKRLLPPVPRPVSPGCKSGRDAPLACPSDGGRWVSLLSVHPLPSAEGWHGPSRVSSQASSSLRGTVPCCPLARSPVDVCPVLSGFRPSVAVGGHAHCPFLGHGATLSEQRCVASHSRVPYISKNL